MQIFTRGTLALSVLGWLLPGAVNAEPVTLTFAPPEMERVAICLPGLPDNQLEAMWAAWDRKSLPDQSPELLRRDLRRLIDINPINWFDTVEAAYALMPSVDPKFTAEKALLERIILLDAAGRIKELTNQRLVEQLMQSQLSTSPRMQGILADYLLTGTGVAQDLDRGMKLMVAAAFGGNADALLKIVTLQQSGTVVPGWDVPPDIAVTMAFGALVGKLDPMICDRVARIGREYLSGEIVSRDVAQAEAWFRFSADLGDSQAAWKVAELHLRSEDIVKSNTVLIEYLTKAANGGLPFAQVALGRLYESGTLLEQDTARAAQLYADAAAFGDRAGVVRNVLFLQAEAEADEARHPDYLAALAALATRDDAPGWAFISQADLILAEKGRWAGEQEATVLFEKAAAIGDVDAVKRLMPIRFRQATSADAFYEIIDSASETVQLGGEIDPMNGLRNAFVCRSPNAPQREEAAYWEGLSAATVSKTVDFSPAELLAIAADPDVSRMTRLQSQALYGRPAALAQYMAVLDRNGASQTQRDFWTTYATRFEKVSSARGRLEAKFAEIGQAIGDPVDHLRRAVAEDDPSAGVDLADMLLTRDPEANRAEALAALEPLAARGEGAALEMLTRADPQRYPGSAEVFAQYADQIEARGDFRAILLALPHLTDPARLTDYIGRATALTDCSFDQALQMADALGGIDDDNYAKWIEIADFLAASDPWRLVQLADNLRAYGDATTLPRLISYLEASFAGGNVTATHRLLDIYSKPALQTYDPARSAELYVALMAQVVPEAMPRALDRLAKAEPAIRDAVYAQIDLPTLYQTSAEAGSPVAMLEYGKLLRAVAATPTEVEAATGWMLRAAEAGNVDAMLLSADAEAFGIGVPVSREGALQWLTRAAKAGSLEAATKLQGVSMPARVTQ